MPTLPTQPDAVASPLAEQAGHPSPSLAQRLSTLETPPQPLSLIGPRGNPGISGIAAGPYTPRAWPPPPGVPAEAWETLRALPHTLIVLPCGRELAFPDIFLVKRRRRKA
jgi:hypothetical protein